MAIFYYVITWGPNLLSRIMRQNLLLKVDDYKREAAGSQTKNYRLSILQVGPWFGVISPKAGLDWCFLTNAPFQCSFLAPYAFIVWLNESNNSIWMLKGYTFIGFSVQCSVFREEKGRPHRPELENLILAKMRHEPKRFWRRNLVWTLKPEHCQISKIFG